VPFPDDIKNAMRDCILKLLWPKDDIVAFFSTNSCTKSDLHALNDHKSMHRSAIVDTMFAHLTQKPDEGLGQFRAMLQSLITWNHFDPYYFDNLKKLNRADADRSISHLRQLQELRDNRLQEQRKDRERKESNAKAPAAVLAKLKKEFIALLQSEIDGAKRGYALEDVLQSLAKLSRLETTDAFRVAGEQIDGTIKYDGEHYYLCISLQEKLKEKCMGVEYSYQFMDSAKT
jgi:hypothetical protein